MEALADLDSPAKLLELLAKCKESGEQPPLQEMLKALEGMKDVDLGLPPAGNSGPDVEVFPEPGFVIKTVTVRGAKVFINVCSTSKMPLPLGWEVGQIPPEVKQHLEARLGGEAPPSMRIPISMGQPRLDKDHTEQPCAVLDAVVNPQLLVHCSQYRPLKYFIIQLALSMAEKRAEVELNPQYKLPKMRYKGDLPPPPAKIQMQGEAALMQRPSKPVIAEVPKQNEKPSFALLASKGQKRKTTPAAAASSPAAPQGGGEPASTARQHAAQQTAQEAASEGQQQGQQLETLRPQVAYVGRPATAVTITVPLPAAVAVTSRRDSRSISTSVCAETVHVLAPGCQPLSVKLPFAVSAVGGSAEVAEGDSGGASLVLTLPYRPFSSVLEELQEAARAAEGPGSPLSTTLSELD